MRTERSESDSLESGLGNIVVSVKNQLERSGEYAVEKHKELVAKQLAEMDYSKEVINEWLEFID